MADLRALTLHPEWAWAVTHLDKRVENRPERVARMLARYDGVMAIHAGKSFAGRNGVTAALEATIVMTSMAHGAGWIAQTGTGPGIPMFRAAESAVFDIDAITTSAIVATCRTGALVGPYERRPWQAPHSWAVELVEVQVLAEPVPCRGAQGLWTPPEDVARRVLEQVGVPDAPR